MFVRVGVIVTLFGPSLLRKARAAACRRSHRQRGRGVVSRSALASGADPGRG